MANKKTKGKNETNLKGLIVVAILLIGLIIMVSLNGNKKDYSKENESGQGSAGNGENLYLEEMALGNTTVVKAKLFLYQADSIPTIKSGDVINLLTNGQLDFTGKVSIVGDQVTEVKPGGAVSGVLVQLDSLVNISEGEEINIMNGDFQIGTLVVEEIM